MRSELGISGNGRAVTNLAQKITTTVTQSEIQEPGRTVIACAEDEIEAVERREYLRARHSRVWFGHTLPTQA
ncbi:hypothetical protein PCAR4_140024 [Paraburkholderia caribensis]|nr:hypothetical protein PCAR4_140024 [Paraburkholderia caribensis]